MGNICINPGEMAPIEFAHNSGLTTKDFTRMGTMTS